MTESPHFFPPAAMLSQLRWRYAVKKFDPAQTIPEDVWEILEQSLVLAPSSFGLQPWKFFVVKNPDLRKQLKPASWNQTQITDASHLVVFAIRKKMSPAEVDRYIQRIADVRGSTPASLEGFRRVMNDFLGRPIGQFDVDAWACRQLYLAMGVFLTAAAVMGVDACPLEGLDPARYDDILGLNEKNYATQLAAAMGYRSKDDKYATLPKVRFPKEAVVETLE